MTYFILLILGFGILAVYGLYYAYVKTLKAKGLVYQKAGSQKVTCEKDIPYKTDSGKTLSMNLYRPEERQEKLPLIILVHGEGPESFIKDAKDWKLYADYGNMLASHGYVCAVFNHRPAEMYVKCRKIEEANHDVLDFVTFIRENADKWQIDKERIGIWGFSAGALYLNAFMHKPEGFVKFIISYYGVLDLKTWIEQTTAQTEKYSPDKYITEDTQKVKSLLIVKAGKDAEKINRGTDNFIKALKEYQVPHQFILHKSGRHAFDALDNNEETAKIMEKTIAFIKEAL